MLVSPFNLPSFIRHAYGYYATIRIGKCHNGHSQSLRVYLNAFAIKCLVLFTGLYFLYSHINGFNYSNVIYILFTIVGYIFCCHHRFLFKSLISPHTMVLQKYPIERKSQ